MVNHKLLFLILVFIFNIKAYAYDPVDGNIAVTSGPFVYRSLFPETNPGAKSGYQGDFGLILNGDLNNKGSLEIAIFHMNKLYYREQNALSQVEQTQVIQIAMGYRHWLNPYFSGALGFYSGYPMDDATVVHTDFAPGTEISTSARDKTEYGFDFSIQSELWQSGHFSAVADARYAFSVTNQSNEKGDHFGLMIGLKYVFQTYVGR